MAKKKSRKKAAKNSPQKPEKRHDMTWRDHLIMLLHIGAAIEHALMVQYLYAAYSLGGEQVPSRHRRTVQRWRETILSVAREEMGHLLTVQNILTLVGAPVSLNRENFPWDVEYYPFPFVLEPLSLGSLACYVYAEMPEHEHFAEKSQIRRRARDHGGKRKKGKLHSVGVLYSQIIEVIKRPDRIPDSVFQEASIGAQASWDDWGRHYGAEPRRMSVEGDLRKMKRAEKKKNQAKAQVLINRVATRTEALAALEELSAQGEGPHGAKEGEWSHFQRFMTIFREWKEILKKDRSSKKKRGSSTRKKNRGSFTRPVATNPNTWDNPDNPDQKGAIDAKDTLDWAHLFNIRYRLLLDMLAHSYRLQRTEPNDEPSARAMLMHRVFCEMYNLKTIAGILVELPLKERDREKDDEKNNHRKRGRKSREEALCAGPPFEMPYNLMLPDDEADSWQLHHDVLAEAQEACYRALNRKNAEGKLYIDALPEGKAYIEALIHLDQQTREAIDKVLADLKGGERIPA
jgi:hypothetical protein